MTKNQEFHMFLLALSHIFGEFSSNFDPSIHEAKQKLHRPGPSCLPSACRARQLRGWKLLGVQRHWAPNQWKKLGLPQDLEDDLYCLSFSRLKLDSFGPITSFETDAKNLERVGLYAADVHACCQTAPLPPAAFWVSPESGVVGASEVSDFSDVQFCCEPKSKLRWSQTAALQ